MLIWVMSNSIYREVPYNKQNYIILNNTKQYYKIYL